MRLLAVPIAIALICPGVACKASNLRDLGMPVRTTLCWVKGLIPRPQGQPGADLWATTYNPAGADAVRYNPDTGEVKTWKLTGTSEAWDVVRAKDGSLYLGGRGAMLYRVNAETDGLDILGPSPTNSFVRALSAGADGMVYGGGIEGDTIWQFDPATGKFTSLGPLGSGVGYVAALQAVDSGKVFVGLGMPARLGFTDPVTREHKQVLPEAYFGDSFVYDFFYDGGNFAYAFVWPSARLLVLDCRDGHFVRELKAPEGEKPYAARMADKSGRLWMGQAGVRELTVYDPVKDAFAKRSPSNLPPPYAQVSMSADGFITHRSREGKIIRQVQAPVSTTQENVFAMGVGPDGEVYSDGFQVLHLFVTDPATAKSTDLGQLDTAASGETYSYAADDKYLYIAKYTHGGVYRYDPTQPYRPTRSAPDANPRLLCELNMPVYRPAYNCWGPDGKLWYAGYAGWGWTGCGVGWVSVKTGDFGATHLPSAGLSGIASLPPDHVAVAAGSSLLIWSTETGQQESAVEMPAATVATDGEGLLWVASGERLKAFRWQNGLQPVGEWKSAFGGVRELAEGRDGVVYGLAGGALFGLPQGGGEPTKLADCPAAAVHLSPGPGGKFYFSVGPNLYELAP
jgi:streptogramin lyase